MWDLLVRGVFLLRNWNDPFYNLPSNLSNLQLCRLLRKKSIGVTQCTCVCMHVRTCTVIPVTNVLWNSTDCKSCTSVLLSLLTMGCSLQYEKCSSSPYSTRNGFKAAPLVPQSCLVPAVVWAPSAVPPSSPLRQCPALEERPCPAHGWPRPGPRAVRAGGAVQSRRRKRSWSVFRHHF